MTKRAPPKDDTVEDGEEAGGVEEGGGEQDRAGHQLLILPHHGQV